jgi:hypothetical protein
MKATQFSCARHGTTGVLYGLQLHCSVPLIETTQLPDGHSALDVHCPGR